MILTLESKNEIGRGIHKVLRLEVYADQPGRHRRRDKK
jgi:hypothetical protein